MAIDIDWNGINSGIDSGDIVEANLTVSFSNIENALNTLDMSLTTFKEESVFTDEFQANNPDTYTTNGHYVNTHASLPFGLSGAIIHVVTNDADGKLWQFTEPTVGSNGEGYRVQASTVGTWSSWVRTNDLLISVQATNTDLDTLLYTGKHNVTIGVANTFNFPIDEVLGELEVSKLQNTVDYKQLFIGSSGKTYERTSVGSSFPMPWIETATSSRIQANTDNITEINTLHGLVLSTFSTATQQPSGTGTGNAISVNFGASPITTADVDYDNTTNEFTFKTAGKYDVRFSAHFGRNGTSSESLLVFRTILNGGQAGEPLVAKLDDDDVLLPWSDKQSIEVNAGDVMSGEIMRQAGWHNSGGLYSTTTDWGTAPSASIQIYKVG